jgi:NADPH:quinone reductase-like Zn-dependent oxidoreductase
LTIAQERIVSRRITAVLIDAVLLRPYFQLVLSVEEQRHCQAFHENGTVNITQRDGETGRDGETKRMKALRLSRFGEVQAVLHVEEVPRPVPGPGEVLIEVHAASINPADVKNVQGSFPQTTLPRTPGRDLAGVVVEGDEERIGEEVWASGGDIGFTRDGSHAEYIAIPKRGARPKPKTLSMVEAASIGTNYITAFLGLVKKAGLKEDETVLVTGASGGVGSFP